MLAIHTDAYLERIERDIGDLESEYKALENLSLTAAQIVATLIQKNTELKQVDELQDQVFECVEDALYPLLEVLQDEISDLKDIIQ